MTPYVPEKRDAHTATLIDNKLYILGGYAGKYAKTDAGKDFFYLDVSVPFNTQHLLWKDLSSINTVPSHESAASVNGGENNNTLFLYGGTSTTEMDLVYTFNPQSNSWSAPVITGSTPIKKSGLTGIVDQNGKMYLWSGGYAKVYINDLLILDTKTLIWGQGSTIGGPIARMYYGATLLSDSSTIIYMGGYNGIELAVSQVYLYDTINNNWSVKATAGTIPSVRDGFSVVLGLDGQRAIIFGGTATINDDNLTPEDSLYELNVINFEWRIPKISGNIPKSRMYHKANLIGKYMVISFGVGYDRLIESDILLLDISNVDEYIWTNDFYPPSPPTPPTPPLPPTSSSKVSSQSATSSSDIQSATPNTTPMVGAVLGSLFSGVVLSSMVFFLYRWNKNRHIGDDNLQAERNIYNHGQEIVQPLENEDITNHVSMSTPAPIVKQNDDRLTLHELKQEIQDLRQIIVQNNGQSTSSMRN
ncbi:hypothetical protein RclHR1_03040004 [Rhizophagus clarus]|uniref:Galactose oxidase n=1 Tax=Rhizophagus clarus TaxID=94130 RepID=A0A2Z6R5J4_9GLOM|nr:hypothetical protein RclHR1_03040004 [Rhizophagus clarus]GET01587.1 hypothetical protein GLOIN_2v1761507 [Rhizophagus clarus]